MTKKISFLVYKKAQRTIFKKIPYNLKINRAYIGFIK